MTSITMTAFDENTGDYILTMSAPYEADIRFHVGMDRILVEGEFPENTYYKNGSVLQMPEKPTPDRFWVFDTSTESWFDVRTPEQIETDLNQRREQASMSRIDFLLAANKAGIISKEETIQAANREVPQSMASLFALMTPEQQFEAEVRWAGATVITRTDPFINQWAMMLGVTQEQLDALFGI